MTDTRHANCRQRLIDEGKPFGKSGCTACGMSVFTPGFGTKCNADGSMSLPPQEKLKQLRLVSDGMKVQLLTPDGRDLLPDLQVSKLTIEFDPAELNTLTIQTKFVQIDQVIPQEKA